MLFELSLLSLFLHSSASHPLMSRKETLRKKKFKKWQPRSFHFMLHVLVQLLSRVQLFVTPGLHQVRLPCPSPSPGACSNSCPLSESCHPAISSSVHPLLLLPSVFPNLRVFSKESALHIRWPKYWSFSFSIRSSNDY